MISRSRAPNVKAPNSRIKRNLMQPNFQNASTVKVMDTRSATLVALVLRREGKLIIQPTLRPYNRKMINLFSNNHNNWLSTNLLRLRLPSSHNPWAKLTLPEITALSSRVVNKNFFVIDSGATWSTYNPSSPSPVLCYSHWLCVHPCMATIPAAADLADASDEVVLPDLSWDEDVDME